jgi:hypothetical protein
MKPTQAWGWLAAGMLAAGINAAYHDGGLQWAHRIADRAQHISEAVVALASGRADQFLAEAKTLSARNDDQVMAFSDTVVATADHEMARAEAAYVRAEARAEAHCVRMQAERARMEARTEAHRALVRIPDVRVETAMIQIPGVPAISIPRVELSPMRVHCSQIRMSLPALPNRRMPAPPAVKISFSNEDSVE